MTLLKVEIQVYEIFKTSTGVRTEMALPKFKYLKASTGMETKMALFKFQIPCVEMNLLTLTILLILFWCIFHNAKLDATKNHPRIILIARVSSSKCQIYHQRMKLY